MYMIIVPEAETPDPMTAVALFIMENTVLSTRTLQGVVGAHSAPTVSVLLGLPLNAAENPMTAGGLIC